MHPVSGAQLNYILSLLDSGQSATQISSSTGLHFSTISRLHRKHCPYLQKPSGGRPPKLSEADTRYALHLITSRKAENAVQITQTLQDITTHSPDYQKPLEKCWDEGCCQGQKASPH